MPEPFYNLGTLPKEKSNHGKEAIVKLTEQEIRSIIGWFSVIFEQDTVEISVIEKMRDSLRRLLAEGESR